MVFKYLFIWAVKGIGWIGGQGDKLLYFDVIYVLWVAVSLAGLTDSTVKAEPTIGDRWWGGRSGDKV